MNVDSNNLSIEFPIFSNQQQQDQRLLSEQQFPIKKGSLWSQAENAKPFKNFKARKIGTSSAEIQNWYS
jgi:hypothetical protein